MVGGEYSCTREGWYIPVALGKHEIGEHIVLSASSLPCFREWQRLLRPLIPIRLTSSKRSSRPSKSSRLIFAYNQPCTPSSSSQQSSQPAPPSSLSHHEEAATSAPSAQLHTPPTHPAGTRPSTTSASTRATFPLPSPADNSTAAHEAQAKASSLLGTNSNAQLIRSSAGVRSLVCIPGRARKSATFQRTRGRGWGILII